MSKSSKTTAAEVQFSKKETSAPQVMGETVAITGNGVATSSGAGDPVYIDPYQANTATFRGIVQPTLYRYEFKPQPDITVYELAQSMPYIVNAIHSVNKKEECNCKYLRHFEITPF
jgi:hypothetical protein